DYSVKTIAQMTPIDQYIAIETKFEVSRGQEQADPVYVTDIFDAGGRLSETGRLAFLGWCTYHAGDNFEDDDSVKLAVCTDDIAKWNVTKMFDEVRADKAHDPVARMVIRDAAYKMAAKLKEGAELKAKVVKKD